MDQSSTASRSGDFTETGSDRQVLAEQDNLFQQGLQCHQQGENDQALYLYQQVMAADPNHAESHFYTAILLGDSECYDQALPLLEKAHELQPAQPAILYQLGVYQSILGQNNSAIESFNKVMNIDPEHWQAAYNLGAAHYAVGNIPEAIHAYSLAARLNPNDADIFFNLGLAYSKAGAIQEAIDSYLTSREIEPDDPNIHYNLGRLYKEKGDKNNAINSLETAIALQPDFGAALTNIGVLYVCQGMTDKAIAVYKKLIKIGHTKTSASHILNALQETTTDAAPIDYVKDLFDDFADHFEERLLHDLSYNTPHIFVDLFKNKVNHEKSTNLRMLDLGCGTGLCGEAFAEIVNYSTGVDISSKMVAKARKKNIYNQLIIDDIISFLESSPDTYDLIVASDVFVYLGELESIFRLLPKWLARNGKIIFSTEYYDGKGYKLRKSCRYAHSRSYINILAQENNLQIALMTPAKLRKENDCWIDGDIYMMVS